MAVNIFEKYGIKQVANVYFEALSTDAKAGVYEGDIVLFLDTLKVSTIETTAENVAAQGGWGNPRLISWDYGKEINVTLTDALMSLQSLRFMMGGAIKEAKEGQEIWVKRTAEAKVNEQGKLQWIDSKIFDAANDIKPTASYGHPVKVLNLTRGTRTQIKVDKSGDYLLVGDNGVRFYNAFHSGVNKVGQAEGFDATSTVTTETDEVPMPGKNLPGDLIRFFWDEKRDGSKGTSAVEVTISPSTFPGTYRVVGDTFMRNSNGADEPFQFIIEKAKVQSNVTLTLEAEGDPTTFEMTLQVLRDEAGEEMMKLVRYDTKSTASEDEKNDYGSFIGATATTDDPFIEGTTPDGHSGEPGQDGEPGDETTTTTDDGNG